MNKKNQLVKTGKVISNKMAKTLVVGVERLMLHPIYKKNLVLSNKYHVHCLDEKKFNIGDDVKITPCRPCAKTVKWMVVETSNKEK